MQRGAAPTGASDRTGWFVVAGLFVTMAMSSGFAFYNLSVYMNALVETRGFSVASVSASTSVFFVTGGLAGMPVGWLVQRFDPRWTMTGGAVLAAAAVLLVGRVQSLTELYAVYVLFGMGNAGFGLVPGTTLVARWFERNRAIALSVTSTGLSVGGMVVTPLSAQLIERLGLPGAVPWLAAGLLLGVVPATWLLVRTPRDRHHAGADGAPLPGTPYGDAVRSRFFRGATAAYVGIMLAQVGGISHLYNLGDARVSSELAATAVSALAACSIGGRFLGGWLLSFVPARPFALVNCVLQALGLALLATAGSGTQLLLGAGLFGTCVGNLLMLQPLLIAEAFGVRDYGRIFATANLVTAAGPASGPLLLGFVHDLSDGYAGAYGAGAGAALAGFLLLLAAGPTRAKEPDRASGGP